MIEDGSEDSPIQLGDCSYIEEWMAFITYHQRIHLHPIITESRKDVRNMSNVVFAESCINFLFVDEIFAVCKHFQHQACRGTNRCATSVSVFQKIKRYFLECEVATVCILVGKTAT
jgi:hypothetical protein